MPKALLIYSNSNRPGKRDATGAFIPAAKKAKAHLEEHGWEVSMLPMLGQSRPKIMRAVAEEKPTMVVFFCHGTRSSLQLWGKQANDLGTLFFDNTVKRAVFFCCSLADQRKKNFLDTLVENYARWLELAGTREVAHFTAIGHSTAGHTTNNPNVWTYYTKTLVGGYGKYALNKPGTEAFARFASKLRKQAYWLMMLTDASFAG